MEERRVGRNALTFEDFLAEEALRLLGTPTAPTQSQRARALIAEIQEIEKTVQESPAPPKKNPAVP